MPQCPAPPPLTYNRGDFVDRVNGAVDCLSRLDDRSDGALHGFDLRHNIAQETAFAFLGLVR